MTAAAVLGGLVVGGCSGPEAAQPGPTTTPTASGDVAGPGAGPTATAVGPTDGASPADASAVTPGTGQDEPVSGDLPSFAADTAPDSAETSGDAALHGVDLRFAVHDGFDRIVLDLVGTGAPGWRARYVDDPTYEAVGGPVPLDGQAALAVHVGGIAWTDPAPPPFQGPTSMTVDGGVVRDLEYGSAFEGEQELFIGLDAEAPFRVFRLEDPARVVIDVRQP
jgi:hypothetical protein